jgi:hypothetical protein
MSPLVYLVVLPNDVGEDVGGHGHTITDWDCVCENVVVADLRFDLVVVDFLAMR